MTASKAVPYHIIIPARYALTRLPGKSLLEIKGKPLIQHVFETATNTQAKNIVIATDNDEIKSTAETFGANVVMTSEKHESGTDRIAEVVSYLKLADDDPMIK